MQRNQNSDYDAVRVILLSNPPAQPYLEFTLIFPDGCEKYYKLDEYAARQYRGLSERSIIEEQARAYFDAINEPTDHIRLVFL